MLPPNGGSEHPRTQAVPGWWRGYQRDVVKLISRYPDGMTGIALLLLRFSCAAAAFPALVSWWSRPDGDAPAAIASAGGLAVALMIGLGTRAVGLLLAVALAAGLFAAKGDRALLLLAAVGGAGALALQGPGAYSVDAHRYGRRVIRLAPRTPDRGGGA